MPTLTNLDPEYLSRDLAVDAIDRGCLIALVEKCLQSENQAYIQVYTGDEILSHRIAFIKPGEPWIEEPITRKDGADLALAIASVLAAQREESPYEVWMDGGGIIQTSDGRSVKLVVASSRVIPDGYHILLRAWPLTAAQLGYIRAESASESPN